MKINNFNIRKTIENAILNNPEFHFFVDVLSKDNYMLTYVGLDDEIYTYDEMNDEFFSFINREINNNGIFIKLITVFSNYYEYNESEDTIAISIECEKFKKNIDCKSFNVPNSEFTNYGIKIKENNVSFGLTVGDGFNEVPYFNEFNNGDEMLFSLNNPLNRVLLNLMKELIVFDD